MSNANSCVDKIKELEGNNRLLSGVEDDISLQTVESKTRQEEGDR